MLVAGCCLVSIPVAAANPRDAVKTLPRVSHTSDFRITESDNASNQTYEDAYYDTWDINWQPQPIALPTGRLSIEARYIKRLGDRLLRHTGTSDDSRQDQYNFTVRLEQAGYLKSHFAIEEIDTRSASFPSGSPASFLTRTRKEAFLTWTPPGLPSISAGHAITTTANYSGTARNHSDEWEWTQIQLNYQHNLGLAAQEVQYLGELTRSYNFYPARTSTSNSKQVWDASRQMPLGNIGNLRLGAHLEENHRREESEPLGTDVNVAQYNLGLDGQVASFPLSYSIGYLSSSQSINNTSASDRTQRRFSLNFIPPVPEGKRAGLSYSSVYDEYSDTYRDTGIQTQSLNWSFQPNPRVSSSIGYEISTNVDRLAKVGTEENENLTGALSYAIPGDRGSYSSSITQSIQRKPEEDSRAITSSVNLATDFRLGSNTRVTLFYNQSNQDNRLSYLAVPATSDYLRSGINYQISPAPGISLNAKWQQHYRLNLPSERKTATQSIELTFNWQTAANWNYSLRVASNDESTRPGGATGNSYQTGDEIQALITYSF
jgi:hypothetical protein